MELHRRQQAFQHRGAEACRIQKVEAGVGGGGFEQGAAGLPAGPAEGGVGAEQLGAAVRRVGVGVHDAARQLAELAHMAHEQHVLKPGRSGHIQRIADEI